MKKTKNRIVKRFAIKIRNKNFSYRHTHTHARTIIKLLENGEKIIDGNVDLIFFLFYS